MPLRPIVRERNSYSYRGSAACWGYKDPRGFARPRDKGPVQIRHPQTSQHTQRKIRSDEGWRSPLFPAIHLTRETNLFTNGLSLSSANDPSQPHNRIVSHDGDALLRPGDWANGPSLAGG